MIMIYPGLYGISYKKSCFYGRYKQYPLYSVRFLFVHVVWVSQATNLLMLKAMEGLIQDPDWLTENTPSVRLARKKALAKAKAAAEKEYRGDIDHYYELYQQERRRNNDLQNEVIALRRVIKGLQDSTV